MAPGRRRRVVLAINGEDVSGCSLAAIKGLTISQVRDLSVSLCLSLCPSQSLSQSLSVSLSLSVSFFLSDSSPQHTQPHPSQSIVN
jgi:hypothetical protein